MPVTLFRPTGVQSILSRWRLGSPYIRCLYIDELEAREPGGQENHIDQMDASKFIKTNWRSGNPYIRPGDQDVHIDELKAKMSIYELDGGESVWA